MTWVQMRKKCKQHLSPPLAGEVRGWGSLISLISLIGLISWISANQAQDDVTISPPLRGRLGGVGCGIICTMRDSETSSE